MSTSDDLTREPPKQIALASAVMLALCTPVKSPAPSRQASVLCVGNDAGGRAMPEMRTHADEVCAAFRNQGLTAVDARDEGRASRDLEDAAIIWPDLGRSWATSSEAPAPKVLFYEGHGKVEACPGWSDKRHVCLFAPGGARFGWERLARTVRGAEGDRGWGVMVLNACDSGFADVRQMPAPFTLIASGFGVLPSKDFAQRLHGAVNDPDADANCDGVTSDLELQQYVNAKPQEGLPQASSNPIAVVRRQANAEVPVLWTRRQSARCAGRRRLHELVQDPWFSSLPCMLRRDLQQQAEMLDGERRTLVESTIRYLVIHDERRECPSSDGAFDAQVLPLLRQRIGALGYHIIDTGCDPGFRDFSLQMARVGTFSSFYLLAVTDCGLRLTSLRDHELLLSIPGNFGLCGAGDGTRESPSIGQFSAVALRIARCLPTRVQVAGPTTGTLGLACESSDPDHAASSPCISLQGAQSCVAIHVDGRFPRQGAVLVRWDEFWAQSTLARPEPLDLANARAIPCRNGVGQCFDVPHAKDDIRRPQDWLLLEPAIAGGTEQCDG